MLGQDFQVEVYCANLVTISWVIVIFGEAVILKLGVQSSS